MNTTEVQEHLRRIGWRIAADGELGPTSRAAVRDFQWGWNGPRDPLAVDGQPGPATQWALAFCTDQGNLHCSKFYRFDEFRSKGNGWIKVSRQLAWALDRYREKVGPTAIVSGYRDPAHNAAVGGAKASRHMAGDAADLNPAVSLDAVRAWRLFTGIGYQGATGRVRHVDMRPGNPASPTVWRYGS